MARGFKLLTVLWLVSACVASATTTGITVPTAKPTTPGPITTGGTGPTVKPPTPGPTTPGGTGPTVKPPTPGPTTPGGTGPTAKPTTPGPTTPGGTGPTVKPPTPGPTTPGGTGPTVKPPTPGPTTPGGTGPTAKPTTPGPTTPGGTGPTVKPPTPGPTTPGGTGPTVKPPTPGPTTPDPCLPESCGDGSTCSPRFNGTFVCLCLAGDVYNEDRQTCDSAKVYPGELTLPGKKYTPAMNDPTSKDFLKTSSEISEELKKALTETKGYVGSTVLKLRPIPEPSRFWSRAEARVLADVENIFKTDTDYEATEIQTTLTNYIENNKDSPLAGGNFTVGNLCEKSVCDVKTTVCKTEKGAYSCNCKEDYIETSHSTSMCIACSSGKKPSGPSSCEDCPYGYSGFNCKESWKLALVVVGSVFGALLLISVIGLAVMSTRPAKKSSKKNKDEKFNSFPAKAPLVTTTTANSRQISVNGSANGYANAGVPRIPRATTNSLDRRTNLEMFPSNSRQNPSPAGRNTRLYDDPDDVNPYARSRPQNNPYAQSRAQTNLNPNQGHSNPYYRHDNGRPLY
ncbi:mucin-13b isoform X3 [Notolabrus celidotus]|uniref:mucin-13b isoform X3 n=1 Tax=Notolabrus celidotus TaxID=1203425 RepID=UPI00149009AC|nr:mucin-13b isoform X3 [Notolabrus celidotus]